MEHPKGAFPLYRKILLATVIARSDAALNSRRTRIVAALLPGVITTVTALLKLYSD